MDNLGLHRFTVLVAVCTFLLVVAGSLVTSNDAALSVPDWPLSWGKLVPPLEGGIRYEFAHRALAALVARTHHHDGGVDRAGRAPPVDAPAGLGGRRGGAGAGCFGRCGGAAGDAENRDHRACLPGATLFRFGGRAGRWADYRAA